MTATYPRVNEELLDRDPPLSLHQRLSRVHPYRQLSQHAKRAGNVMMLTLFLLVGLLGCVAFAVDLGYLSMARTELQRTADAAALAAGWDLLNNNAVKFDFDMQAEITAARAQAQSYSLLNTVCNTGPSLDANTSNSQSGDIVIGYLSNPSDPACAWSFNNSQLFNAVQVTVNRGINQNGEVPLFFSRIWGLTGQTMSATATAALNNNFGGFEISSGGGGNLQILPFALDEVTWNALMNGNGSDNYSYDPATGNVTSGSDGVLEVNLYPQGTGSPGNRGTVDIGGGNNSTNDIARQIVDGISPADLEALGKPLKLNESGELTLNGDTGISAGVKDELASIIGQPRIIPIFRTVVGPGNNATYTIVKFAGVRLLNVKLTGSMSSKKVMIQPARLVVKGGIPSTTQGTSYFLYSPVRLVR
ncbi:MAG: pilus assembly protein TadG-related protein [Pirellulales bacterium]|nr:pilus assembly protein TadG-related protein [Pirellulales bacterium]